MYYGRSANQSVDLNLGLIIEGIPYIFLERAIPGAFFAADQIQLPVIVRAEEGESGIDYDLRRETAATLDIEMLDETGTLDAVFSSAVRSKTWVAANALATDTTITVNSTAGIVAGQQIYINAETITVGVVASATSLTGCTRGAHGSTAAALWGTASDGNSVYVIPPSWMGRRASLWGYTPDPSQVSPGNMSSVLLSTFIVDESPMLEGDDRWTLRLAGVVQEYWERSVGFGLQPVEAYSVSSMSETTITLKVEDASFFRTSQTDNYVFISGHDGDGAVHKLSSVTLPDFVTIERAPSFGMPRKIKRIDQFRPGATVRNFAVCSPSLLKLLLRSDEGQPGATTNDVYPGRKPQSADRMGWRVGAAFKASEIDTAAFDEAFIGTEGTFVVQKEEKLTDILKECALLANVVFVSTADGKLKPVSLASPRITSTTTLGADDVIPDGPVSVTHDENGVYPIIKARAGYCPINDKYSLEENLYNADLAQRYPRNTRSVSFDFRSIGIAGKIPKNVTSAVWQNPTQLSLEELVVYTESLMRGSTLGRRILSLSLTHKHLGLRLGDIVTIGSDLPSAYSGLSDFRLGTIVGRSARVISRRPRYDQGRVDIGLELIDRSIHVCPAAVITAISGTTLTLQSTGANPEMLSTSPAFQFWVGATVRMIDRSQGAGANAPFFAGITSIPNATQIVVAAVPTWPLAANEDVVVLDPDLSDPGTSSSGYSLIDAAMIAGSDGIAGTSAPFTEDEPRWG